jgi:ferredoxin
MGGRALVLLAWHFLRHVLGKLTFRYDRGGAKRFLTNYAADGALPVSVHDAQLLPAAQQCIGCGMCDAHCHAEGGISVLVRMASGPRDLSELPLAAPEGLACTACAGCATVCPVGVPIADTLAFLSRQGEQGSAVVLGS